MKETRPPTMTDLRLLPGCCALWISTWWATSTTATHTKEITLTLIATSALLAYSKWHHERGRHPPAHALTPPGSLRYALALALTCSAGGLLIGTAALHAHTTDPAFSLTGTIHARIQLERDPSISLTPGKIPNVRARILTIGTANAPTQPSRAYALISSSQWKDTWRGDIYEITGTIDHSFYADAPAIGTIRAQHATLIHRSGGANKWARNIRASFARICSSLPAHDQGLVPGMSIGDDRRTPPELKEAMRTSSLSHLTAISGSHIVIILSVLAFILPGNRWGRAAVISTALALIVLIVGPEASVIRSVCMAGVGVGALVIGRDGQPIAALCAVVSTIILVDPWASRSYAFALSVVAAFAVIGPARAVMRRARTRIRDDTIAGRAAYTLVALFTVPTCAQLATAPIVVSFNGTVSLWGIVANILVQPAVPVATVMGLTGALLAPVWPGGAYGCAWIAHIATQWIARIALWCADLPQAQVSIPGGASTIVGMYLSAACGWGMWKAWMTWRMQIELMG